MLQANTNFTMNWLLGMFKGSKQEAPNDSMSFIDVRDCAAMHIAAMEHDSARGRFFSVVEALHWNDTFVMMKELLPSMPTVKPCEGEPVRVTKFDTTKMMTLGVNPRSVQDIFKEARDDFVAKGLLGA